MNNDSCQCRRDSRLRAATRKYAVFSACALAIIIFDQATKIWISHYSGLPLGVYPPIGGHEIIPGFFSIVYNRNPGAAWGMLAGQRILLALLAIGAGAAIIILRKNIELHKTSMQLVFGLMLGGIVGNLIDRVVFGSVTDFLDFTFGSYRYPTFNIADSSMVVAVGCYILHTLFFQNKSEATTVTNDRSDTTG
jgi:signal peptidase II